MGKVQFSYYKDCQEATDVSLTFALLYRVVVPVNLLLGFGVLEIISKIIPSKTNLPGAVWIILYIAIVIALSFFGIKLLRKLEERAIQKAIERAYAEYSNIEMLYCMKCDSMYSRDKNDNHSKCPECNSELKNTGITKAQWITYSESKKQELKTALRVVEQARQRKKALPVINEPVKNENAPAKNEIDQIREYKKLLDDGAITQEEFDKLKQRILKL